MKILRAEHLIKTYGKGLTEIRALDDVTLDVGSGSDRPPDGLESPLATGFELREAGSCHE